MPVPHRGHYSVLSVVADRERLIKMWLEAQVEETGEKGNKHWSTRNRDLLPFQSGRGCPYRKCYPARVPFEISNGGASAGRLVPL
jgi:hypothetical protein